MKYLLILCSVALLSACSSPKSGLGKIAELESQAYEQISDQYDEGQKDAAAGEKTITKGRKLIEEGRAEVREGDEKVYEGNEMVQSSRAQYARDTDYVSTPESPSEIQTSTDKLTGIGEEWEKGIGLVKKGNKLISSGNDKIDEGEAKIREGRSQVERGKSLMREAEAAYNTRKSNFRNYP